MVDPRKLPKRATALARPTNIVVAEQPLWHEARQAMKSGDLLGSWRLVDRLGRGGNGEVWRCVGSDGARAAIKVLLQQRDRERLGRFRNEVSFLLDHGRRQGVVPIIGHDLSGTGRVWYVMPLAVPIRTALGPEPAPQQALAAIAAVTRTLAALAEDGIFHRDLKPDNLFRLDQVWSVGDFGLVKYPSGEALTRRGRKLGPIHFMAPEMRESPDTADGELADVYAIAKTLWVLLADSNLPFPGQHRADDEICRLTARLDHRWAPQLDLLIEHCTSNDPSMRPRMREVAAELDAMTKPTTKAAAIGDTVGLERRIAAMTELHHRRDQDRARLYERAARAWQQIEEEVARPAYWALANRLPRFQTRHPVQVAMPRSLLQPPSAYPSYEWGGTITAPGNAGARVDLGVSLRVHDQAGRCTVAAVVAINQHNQGRGLTVSVLEPVFHTTIGTAHFDTTLAKVQSAFAGGAAETLVKLEEALEAERQLAAQVQHASSQR
jgi:hypothetical protein